MHMRTASHSSRLQADVAKLSQCAHAGPTVMPEEYAHRRGEVKLCDLCERPTALTEHHLIPRTLA